MKKNIIKYMITAQPERPESLYYDEKGDKVEKQFATEFYSIEMAKDFAKEHNIDLNGTMNSIVVK